MIGLIDVDGNNSIRMVSLDGDSLIVYPKRTVACEDSIPAPIPFQYEGTDQFYAYPIHCIDDDKWSYVIISDEGRNNLETWLVEDYCHPFHIGAAAVLRGFIEAIDIEKIRTLRYSVPELNSFWIPGQLEDRHTQGNVGFTLSPPQTFDVALFPQKGLTFEGCLTPRIIKDEEELLAIRLQSQLELTLATPISLDILSQIPAGFSNYDGLKPASRLAF